MTRRMGDILSGIECERYMSGNYSSIVVRAKHEPGQPAVQQSDPSTQSISRLEEKCARVLTLELFRRGSEDMGSDRS